MGVAGIGVVITLLLLFAEWEHAMASAHNLPWAGIRNELFRLTRASMRQLKNTSQTIADGYAQVNCHLRFLKTAWLVSQSLSSSAKMTGHSSCPTWPSGYLLPQEHIK